MAKRCCVCGKKYTFIRKIKELFQPIECIVNGTAFVDIGGNTFCSSKCYLEFMNKFEGDSWKEEVIRQSEHDGLLNPTMLRRNSDDR